MTTKSKAARIIILIVLLSATFYFRHKYDDQSTVGLIHDPRNEIVLYKVIQQRESDSFQSRLKSGSLPDLTWPGLKSADISWTWLQMLQGLHHKESYEGDYSWLFSKIDHIVRFTPDSELRFISGLTPFMFVIGNDSIGSTIVMNELIKRAPWSYHVWFWGAFHSLENIHQKKLAGDMYFRASQIKGAPDYLVGLSIRLSRGDDYLTDPEKIEILKKELPHEAMEKLKRAKPELF